MLGPFFAIAMAAPHRQRAFRLAAVAHVVVFGGLTLAALRGERLAPGAAELLVVAGVVEGAAIVGWRLTQMPKSQALEFLLVSPVQPRRLFVAESAVGLARLALVQLTGLPFAVLLIAAGRVQLIDLPSLLVAPWLWGAVVGVGITAWAYEGRRVRRYGELIGFVGVLLYLVVGVLAGEKLRLWLQWLPDAPRWWALEAYIRAHQWNPFAVQQYWFHPGRDPLTALERWAGVQLAGVAILAVLFARAACRLKGHFHDRHYRPLSEVTPADPSGIGDRPLAWWAVRRVMEYSGRMNIYLAGGFGMVYAAFLVAGDSWPDWMGRVVFTIVERAGGVPTVTTGLVLLAAVPAAFQYGLWDSSGPERLRRLELLLLTELAGRDYWDAAAAAAWRRGRGYFAVAAVIWAAAVHSGRFPVSHVLAAAAGAVVLCGLYFALGFRAFAGGYQASGLGSLLTIGAPLATYLAVQRGWPAVAAWTPPGMVYLPLAGNTGPATWLPVVVLAAFVLAVSRSIREGCVSALSRWHNAHCGIKVQ